MGWIDKIKMLSEWAPLLGMVQQITAENDQRQRALLVIEALSFAASKSDTVIDDEVLSHFEAILMSPQGASFFDYVAGKLEAMR